MIYTIEYTTITICFISASSEDLASNKPASQKSDWSSTYVAGKAVDGDFNSYSCTTTSENYPYWSVDLGITTYVDHLYITNVQTRNGELLDLKKNNLHFDFLFFYNLLPGIQLIIRLISFGLVSSLVKTGTKP